MRQGKILKRAPSCSVASRIPIVPRDLSSGWRPLAVFSPYWSLGTSTIEMYPPEFQGRMGILTCATVASKRSARLDIQCVA